MITIELEDLEYWAGWIFSTRSCSAWMGKVPYYSNDMNEVEFMLGEIQRRGVVMRINAKRDGGKWKKLESGEDSNLEVEEDL